MKPARTDVGIPGVTLVLEWSVTTTKIELQFGVIRGTWLQTQVPVVMWLQRCELDRLFWPRMSWKLQLRVGSPSDTCRPHLLVPTPLPEFPVCSGTGRKWTRACWWKRGAPWQAFRLLLTPHSPAVVTNQLLPNASVCWKQEGFPVPRAFNHSCLCSFSSRTSSLLVLTLMCTFLLTPGCLEFHAVWLWILCRPPLHVYSVPQPQDLIDVFQKMMPLVAGAFCCLFIHSLSRVWLFATPWAAAHQSPCPSPSPRVCSDSCPLSQWSIQPSHLLLPSSPPALSLSQHQGLFQWVSSSHQVAKVLKLEHQSFQWIFNEFSFRIDWFAVQFH